MVRKLAEARGKKTTTPDSTSGTPARPLSPISRHDTPARPLSSLSGRDTPARPLSSLSGRDTPARPHSSISARSDSEWDAEPRQDATQNRIKSRYIWNQGRERAGNVHYDRPASVASSVQGKSGYIWNQDKGHVRRPASSTSSVTSMQGWYNVWSGKGDKRGPDSYIDPSVPNRGPRVS
jgi:hypothetical protein